MIYVTTKNTLYSSHMLKNHKGKCARLHGHQYEIEITLKAPYKEIEKDDCNFLIDFYDFDKEWEKLFPSDHININEWIYDNLDVEYLYSVKIYETPTNSCMYIKEVD